MRTIQKTSETIYFGKSKIYLDDLQAIYAIMARASEKVYLQIGNTVYDNLAEASEHVREPYVKRLQMSISKSSEYYVSLSIRQHDSNIFHDAEFVSIGIASEVSQIINMAKLGPAIIWNGWARLAAFIAVMISYYLLSVGRLPSYWSLINPIILLWVFAGELKVFAHEGTISLKRREDFAVAWKPSVQQVVLMILSALSGSVATIVTTWLTKTCK